MANDPLANCRPRNVASNTELTRQTKPAAELSRVQRETDAENAVANPTLIPRLAKRETERAVQNETPAKRTVRRRELESIPTARVANKSDPQPVKQGQDESLTPRDVTVERQTAATAQVARTKSQIPAIPSNVDPRAVQRREDMAMPDDTIAATPTPQRRQNRPVDQTTPSTSAQGVARQ